MDDQSEFASDKVKEITKVYDIAFKPDFLLFLKAFANYNMLSLGQAFKMSMSAFSLREANSAEPPQQKSQSIELSLEQQKALKELLINNTKPSVLEGVTGSGKTIVYLKLAEELLKESGQALILLPEIALTTQIMERLQALLPHKNILQWHSALSPKKRQELWQQAVRGRDIIVIGARSALFLPFANLKLIVVDEEHDASFKQAEGNIYNARDMAVLRAKLEKCRVLLTSATPSIETIYNVVHKKYHYINLENRFGGVLMPAIKIIDMRNEKIKKNNFISGSVREALCEQFAAKKQSLIFLNRKGYAPITICARCGTKSKCPDCSSWLVFHKRKAKLECHYCGHSIPAISKCSNCHSTEMVFYGPGVEKIEEEVKSFLPEAKIVIATSETISNQKEASLLLNNISNHEVDIIIGTQIISKGLDFKLLKLVCIIDADCNYTTGDIRAHERMYQLLTQVSGRSGRDKERGIVLMQTYEPDNHILNSIIKADKESFISSEMHDREISKMPPFSRLAIINISCKNEYRLLEFANELAILMPVTEHIKIMGPSASPLSLLKRDFRYRFILRANKNTNIQKAIGDWLDNIKVPSSIKIKVDIDPYNFI